MMRQRSARPEIAEMDGGAPLPRKSGEMVFHADWERQAFAIAVSLAERGVFAWSEFQQQLIESVAEAEREGDFHPSRGYYESWLVALEQLLERKKLLSETAVE
jgi:nitrile hydratase accessory protein